MKLSIDLENVPAFDDETVASLILEEVRAEIKAYVKRIAKDILGSQEKEMRSVVEKSLRRDWDKIVSQLVEK